MRRKMLQVVFQYLINTFRYSIINLATIYMRFIFSKKISDFMPHFIASHNYTCKQKVLTFSIVILQQTFVFWISYCVHYTSTKQIFHSLSLKEHISTGISIFIKFYQPHHSKLLWRWFSLVANRRRHRTLRHACVYSLKYPTFFLLY